MNYVVLLLALAASPVLPLFATLTFFYAKYKLRKIPSSQNLSGEAVARKILEIEHVQGASVDRAAEIIGNHYDTESRKVMLTDDVLAGSSVYDLAVSAHECGHAQQHHTGYRYMVWWIGVAPIAHFLAFGLQMIGLLAAALFPPALWVVGFGFLLVFLMSIIALPNEIDASRRAMASLDKAGLIANHTERRNIRWVLIAAAGTYVAKAVADLLIAILWLIHARTSNR